MQALHTRLSSVGSRLSLSKSASNFALQVEADGALTALPRAADSLVWCGLRIALDTLEVRHSYERLLSGSTLRCSLVLESRGFGAALRRSLMSFVRSRSHILFFAASINSADTVRANVRGIYDVCARRLVAHFEKTSFSNVGRNPRYLASAIHDAVCFGAKLFSNSRVLRDPLDLAAEGPSNATETTESIEIGYPEVMSESRLHSRLLTRVFADDPARPGGVQRSARGEALGVRGRAAHPGRLLRREVQHRRPTLT